MCKRDVNRFLVALITLISASVVAFAAEPAWVAKSNENAKLLQELDGKYNPEGASELGLEKFDEEIADLSRDRFEAEMSDTHAVISELHKRLVAESDEKVKQDLQILIDNAEARIRSENLSSKY